MQVIPQRSPAYLWPLADKMTEPRLNQGGTACRQIGSGSECS